MVRRNSQRNNMVNNTQATQEQPENNMFDDTFNMASFNDDMVNCQCGFDSMYSVFPQNPMLGQSYVPMQLSPEKVFNEFAGLEAGTIFPELVSMYMPCQSIEENKYLRQVNQTQGGETNA